MFMQVLARMFMQVLATTLGFSWSWTALYECSRLPQLLPEMVILGFFCWSYLWVGSCTFSFVSLCSGLIQLFTFPCMYLQTYSMYILYIQSLLSHITETVRTCWLEKVYNKQCTVCVCYP